VPETIFQCSEISKDFDGVRALRRARLSLFPAEVHALMGENGAGKSTLAKIIAGAIAADDGNFFVDGSRVAIRDPQGAQRLGISIIYQELDLFPHLTVAENLAIGNHQFSERGFVRWTDLDRFATPYLAQVGLACGSRCEVRSLSTAERQLVAIARALSMRARIILMDEPTSALFDDSVERLFRLMGALKQQGVAVVYVSHKMEEIFRICDRVTVMRDGETVGTRAIGEVSPPDLVRMMIGKQWQARDRKPADSSREIVLSCSHLTTAKLRDVSFDLRKGEVLGIAGLLGSGRSEIGLALMGLDRLRKGQVILRGKPVVIRSVTQAVAAGLRWSPEDRKLDGLMMQMSILENGTISDLASMSWCGFVHRDRERRAALIAFGALSLKTASTGLPVRTLSGGNQQKVLLSRCLLGNPEVVFLDDPARGIDVGAKEDIYRIIADLASRGKGIVLVSSELPELLRCCDRILVMREGSIAAQLDARRTTQEEILTWATHTAAPAGGAA
jgi:ribose transport system ATP-binding protein